TREHECAEAIGNQVHRTATGGPKDVDAENRRHWRVPDDVGPAFTHVRPVTTINTLRLYRDNGVAARVLLRHKPHGVRGREKRDRVDDERCLVTDVRGSPTTER